MKSTIRVDPYSTMSTPNVIQIHPAVLKLNHVDRWTDKHTERHTDRQTDRYGGSSSLQKATKTTVKHKIFLWIIRRGRDISLCHHDQTGSEAHKLLSHGYQVLFPEVKWLDSKANDSHLSSSKVNVMLCWLSMHRDNYVYTYLNKCIILQQLSILSIHTTIVSSKWYTFNYLFGRLIFYMFRDAPTHHQENVTIDLNIHCNTAT